MKKLLIFVLFILLTSTNSYAGGCQDDIISPNEKDTKVKFIDKHFELKKFKCKERGGPQYWQVPYVSGNECAKPKVNGCNLTKRTFSFAERDKDLMTPSCNALSLCYATFGLTKERCDKEFEMNIKHTTEKFKGSYSVSIPYTAVIKDANATYNNLQEWGKNNCHK